ncbi:alanine racemase [Nonomuraea typhae]|uniref:alanine racemase n=1 Tax=Nonomuraea typhae TaxID=2603600 RepID=UPI0012F98665|nr:alanine racemase [Nonomuraea typhae]
MTVSTLPIRARALELADAGQLPAYVYDLGELDKHMAVIRYAMSDIEVYYAVKANPDPKLMEVIAPYVQGFEIASGGELAHVREHFPGSRIAIGGPGKTDAELFADVYRLHIESPSEIRRLFMAGRSADVLLRVNLDIPIKGASLAMGGGATPFGMDPTGVAECLDMLKGQDAVRLRGIHAHLASGMDAPTMLELASAILDYARSLGVTEVNIGGGMAVSYADPASRFDWQTYGAGLTALRRPGETLRIEPGRSISVYCLKRHHPAGGTDPRHVRRLPTGQPPFNRATSSRNLRTRASNSAREAASRPSASTSRSTVSGVGRRCPVSIREIVG